MASKVPIMLLLLAALVAAASAATAIEGPKAKPVTDAGKKDRKLLVSASKTGPKELPVLEFGRSGRKLMSSVAAVFPSSHVQAAKTSASSAALRISYPSNSPNDRKLMSTASDTKTYKPAGGPKVGASVASDGRRLMTTRPPMPRQASKIPTVATANP